jgi:hypothetical protein
VAITANAFAEDKAAGMNDVLVEPTAPAVFFATVLRWLSQRSLEASDRRANLF